MISETRKQLLDLIKCSEPVCLDDILVSSELAKSTVREHLTRLEKDGLIKRKYRKCGVGRPKLEFTLTDKAQQLYPHREHELITRLLRFLNQKDQKHLVDEFFTNFWKSSIERSEFYHQLMHSPDVDSKIDALENLLNEQGFMARISRNGDELTLRQCNCPFRNVVDETKLPCQLEKALLEEIFHAIPHRDSYIPHGDSSCTFRIKLK